MHLNQVLAFIRESGLSELLEISRALTDALNEQDNKECGIEVYQAWIRSDDCSGCISEAIIARGQNHE